MIFVFGFALATYLLCLFFFSAKEKESMHAEAAISEEDIMVLIPICNEQDNLPSLLNSLRTFLATDAQISFALNGCKDNSESIILDFIKDVKWRVQLINVEEGHKKKVIQKVADKCIRPWILLLDADIEFHPNAKLLDFLPNLACDLYLYPLALKSNHLKGLLKIVSEVEWTYLQFLTHRLKSKHKLMANAAAMLVKTEHIQSGKGYADNLHIPTGDDIFVIEYLSTISGEILSHKRSIASTTAKSTWDGFRSQRKRWASKNYGLKAVKYRVASALFMLRFVLPMFATLALPVNTIYFKILLVTITIEYTILRGYDIKLRAKHILGLIILPFVYLPIFIGSIIKSIRY